MSEPFHVRLGHLVPDAPAVDFLVDGHPVLTGRAFGQVNDYKSHDAAEYDLAVREHGTDEVLFEAPVPFEPGERYTVLWVGTPEAPSLLVLEDGP